MGLESRQSRQLNFSDIQTALVVSADVCANRHKGNVQSQVAHEKVVEHKEAAYKRILKYVEAVGGATSKEIALALGYGKEIHRISGRLTDLKKLNRLKGTGETREGAEVLVLV